MKFCFLFLSLLLTLIKVSVAYETSLLNDAQRCSRYFSFYEKINRIPSNLLKAVSITESGVWHKESNQHVPWPWAVNINGKSYYYKNKQEAISSVRKFLKEGTKSIDVGCMQINLRYHPAAFKNLEQAFDPKNNIAYAANFLRNNYERHANWHSAVAAYHSENNSRGHPYAQKVLSHWQTIKRTPIIKYAKRHKSRTIVAENNRYYPKKINKIGNYVMKNRMRRKSSLLVNAHNGNNNHAILRSEKLNKIEKIN